MTGAARYFGSEHAAAERLADAVSVAGAECQVGIADQMSTAVYAARHAALVPPGGDAQFLAPLSVKELAAEPSLCHPQRRFGGPVVAHGYSYHRGFRGTGAGGCRLAVR